jgi:hypothetical protein
MMRDVKFSSHIVINDSSTVLHPISTVSNIFSRKQSHPKKILLCFHTRLPEEKREISRACTSTIKKCR